MLARYPEDPTEEQQETLRSFIYLFARLYPWYLPTLLSLCADRGCSLFISGECASHFQGHLKKYPPQVSSRNAAAGWGCFIHNEVNTMLEKPIFDCNNIGDFYDCGCAEDEEGEGGETLKDKKSQSAARDEVDSDDAVSPVEISREPLVTSFDYHGSEDTDQTI